METNASLSSDQLKISSTISQLFLYFLVLEIQISLQTSKFSCELSSRVPFFFPRHDDTHPSALNGNYAFIYNKFLLELRSCKSHSSCHEFQLVVCYKIFLNENISMHCQNQLHQGIAAEFLNFEALFNHGKKR